LNLARVLRYEFESLLHRANATVAKYMDGKSELRTIHLIVPEENISKLETHMPQSGYKYVTGGILNEGKWEKIKYRYRGDYLYHWAWDKKSIRIKTKKKNLFEGLRKFNLQAPKAIEQLNNYFGYALAKEMGLIVPQVELVRLSLNGEDRGVHIKIEQLGETTLRRSRRMPGDIYRGEIVGKDSYTDSLIGSLFHSATVWDKVSINNHYGKNHKKPLENFIKLLRNRKTNEGQIELGKFLDMEAWGRFSAFEALQVSRHFLKNHNQRLYFDPWRQKIIPVIWDPVGWPDGPWRPKADESVTLDVIEHSFHKALYANGDFLRARDKALSDFFDQEKDVKFKEFVSKTFSIMEKEIKTDYYLRPPNVDSVTIGMKEMEEIISRGFKEIKASLSVKPPTVIYSQNNNNITLAVSGRSPVESIQMISSNPLVRTPHTLISYETSSGVKTEDISNRVRVDGNVIILDIGLLSNLSVTRDGPNKLYPQQLTSFPGGYRISFPDTNFALSLREVRVRRRDRWSYAKLSSVKKLAVFKDIFQPVSPSIPNVPLVWTGDVLVTGTMEILRPLIVKAGTKILMAHNASLILRNKVLMEGAENAPVTVGPQFPNQKAWGTVALLGPGASGSSFSHCEFSSGSGMKGDLVEYTGMLSIHDVKGVQIRDCTFKNNTIFDDMVHAVYSNIVFLRTTFDNAYLDALDLDFSEAIIVDSSFKNSGNDAIDLMGTQAKVLGSNIRKSGDKGISVGEASHLMVFNSNLDGNVIGVQAKDQSVALLFNVNISKNKMALSGLKKNWRYGDGGDIFVSPTRLCNPQKEVISRPSIALVKTQPFGAPIFQT
jgi:hypothetical protein